jgi:hypothetical protein
MSPAGGWSPGAVTNTPRTTAVAPPAPDLAVVDGPLIIFL